MVEVVHENYFDFYCSMMEDLVAEVVVVVAAADHHPEV